MRIHRQVILEWAEVKKNYARGIKKLNKLNYCAGRMGTPKPWAPIS